MSFLLHSKIEDEGLLFFEVDCICWNKKKLFELGCQPLQEEFKYSFGILQVVT